jgi:hypothetical protein
MSIPMKCRKTEKALYYVFRLKNSPKFDGWRGGGWQREEGKTSTLYAANWENFCCNYSNQGEHIA